jgi:hypothetical protein
MLHENSADLLNCSGKAFERVWKTTISVEDDDLSCFVGSGVDHEIKFELCSLPWCISSSICYQFATSRMRSLPSPPPSPTLTKYARMLHELRTSEFMQHPSERHLATGCLYTDDVEGDGEVDDMEGGGYGGCASRVFGLEDLEIVWWI